nr:MAG TPA: hypothetical protein [Caudoviricetes sp.]
MTISAFFLLWSCYVLLPPFFHVFIIALFHYNSITIYLQ